MTREWRRLRKIETPPPRRSLILASTLPARGVITLTAHDRRLTLAARSGGCLALDGLSRWLASGGVEAAIEAMAKKVDLPHWESKSAINRAGEALRQQSLTRDQALVLESWRIGHRTVIHTFEALLRARAKKQDIQVAQRLKRRSTIVDKLSRYPSMQLARMDDVAGCRLIFPSIEALREFRNKVLHKAKFRHIRKNDEKKYDYIETPTDRGYRGIHDIYEYRAKRGGKSKKCDGLLIEIQYRTNVQHAWATAVEVVTQLTENEPKFNRGDLRHIKFFCLASEILARAHEGMSALNISNKELYEEFDDLDNEIAVMRMLVDLTIHEWIGYRMDSKSDHVILQISKKGKALQLHQLDLELEASTRLLELEKQFPEDDIVLVGARTVAEVTSAFRNYFNDVREFMDLMIKARERLAPPTGI
jgi:GTP pyrophosphokinase